MKTTLPVRTQQPSSLTSAFADEKNASNDEIGEAEIRAGSKPPLRIAPPADRDDTEGRGAKERRVSGENRVS